MLRPRIFFAFSLCLFLSAVLAAQEMHPVARSTPAFDQLKSLAGEWTGKDSSGDAVKIVYSVVSNGSAIMEHMAPASPHEMVTMYTLDGDRIVVTHYCATGNQPTMQTATTPTANGKYDFSLVRVSGTKTPDEAHMAALTLTIPDKDHLIQVWTYDNHGKTMVNTFTYTRVK
jgi:hypothetical protein